MIDRVERLTNLLALLLETSRPLTLVEIAGELRGQYPEGEANRRATFERDKAALREHRRADRDGGAAAASDAGVIGVLDRP